MDSFELTKIAAAVLSALLLIFFPKTLIEMGMSGHHGSAESGYTLPAATATPAGGPKETAPAAFDAAAVVAMIGTAKPENGAGTFKKCLGCHSAEKGAAAKAGPNLWNVVGRNKGSTEFGGYSEAMKAKASEQWTFANLAGFLHNPKGSLPGTKMLFPGVPDAADLADLLAYIRSLSDSPAPLQ